MVHVGLWDDVTLRFSGDVRLDDMFVGPRLDDSTHDRRQVRFGIRRIEMIANAGADPSARPYTLVVNGLLVWQEFIQSSSGIDNKST